MGSFQDPEGSDKKRIHVYGLGSMEGVRVSITSHVVSPEVEGYLGPKASGYCSGLTLRSRGAHAGFEGSSPPCSDTFNTSRGRAGLSLPPTGSSPAS